MHIKAKTISFLGLLLALSIVMQLVGAYIEISTLTFLMFSSLCVGIACYEAGLRLGGGFLVASVALSFLFMPDKFYCLTYVILCLYIYAIELVRRKTNLQRFVLLLWICKLLLFNAGFLFPALYFYKELMFDSSVNWTIWMYAAVTITANIFLLLYDRLYQLLIPNQWERLKTRFHIHPH